MINAADKVITSSSDSSKILRRLPSPTTKSISDSQRLVSESVLVSKGETVFARSLARSKVSPKVSGGIACNPYHIASTASLTSVGKFRFFNTRGSNKDRLMAILTFFNDFNKTARSNFGLD